MYPCNFCCVQVQQQIQQQVQGSVQEQGSRQEIFYLLFLSLSPYPQRCAIKDLLWISYYGVNKKGGRRRGIEEIIYWWYCRNAIWIYHSCLLGWHDDYLHKRGTDRSATGIIVLGALLNLRQYSYPKLTFYTLSQERLQVCKGECD